MDTSASLPEDKPTSGKWSPSPRDADALGDAFKRAKVRAEGLDGELHRLVCDAVSSARLQRVPIEQVIIAIKAISYEHLPPHTLGSPNDHLIDRVIRLCIDEYYR